MTQLLQSPVSCCRACCRDSVIVVTSGGGGSGGSLIGDGPPVDASTDGMIYTDRLTGAQYYYDLMLPGWRLQIGGA